jgi:hypothetical protein
MSAETKLPDSAIEAVAELQRKAIRGTTFTVDSEPDDVYFISNPDGLIVRRVAEPKPINDRLATPAELASYIGDLTQRDRKPEDGIVLVYPERIDYGFMFESRRHQAHVPLVKTTAFKVIEKLAGTEYQGVYLSQPEVYRLMRVTLRGCLTQGSILPQLIKEMKFENGTTVRGSIDQAKRNLGVEIAGRVSAENNVEIPESFVVTTSLFENFVFPMTFDIDLDPAPADMKFRLTPYPGCIERALRETLGKIREVFDASGNTNQSKPLAPSYIAQ